jgi:hypothetical protein
VPKFEQPGDGKVKRDPRWGRPYIQHPVTGEITTYTRVTTYAGSIEDTYNLGQWQNRNVAYGMALNEALVMQAAAMTEPHGKDKDDLQAVAEAAQEAAKARDAARIGTALHSFTDAYDSTGEIPRNIPRAYRGHIEAYARMLDREQLEPVAMEQFRVNHKLQVAGTADRIYRRIVDGLHYIGDTKSGNIKYGQGKIAIQLALYAYSKPYEPNADRPDTGVTLDDNYPVNRKRAIVVHLPREVEEGETATCEAKFVDLIAGLEGIKLCGMVRAWRKLNGLIVPIST